PSRRQRACTPAGLAEREWPGAAHYEVAFDLRAITAPSLVISGAKDLPDFRLIAARLAALLPGARSVELSWAGHLPTLARPQELSGMLTAYLRDTVPAG
ncbi:MAG: alpha/beta fold hydrolase, partial [Streptosporangiaceae bacterium]